MIAHRAYLVALLGRVRVSARAWAWASLLAALGVAGSLVAIVAAPHSGPASALLLLASALAGLLLAIRGVFAAEGDVRL
jgi:hypothetical protein